jgi:hypothetical protein
MLVIHVHILPSTVMPNFFWFYCVQLRALWYLSSVALEDVEAQKRGMVFIVYAIGSQVSATSHNMAIGRVIQSLPVRLISLHVCCDDLVTQTAATISSLVIGANNTIRFRCHRGTDLEVQYNLMTFGIPTRQLPVSVTGAIDVQKHLQFLDRRRRLESPSNNNKNNVGVNSDLLAWQDESWLSPARVFGSDNAFQQEQQPQQNNRSRSEKFGGKVPIKLPCYTSDIRLSGEGGGSEVNHPGPFDVVFGRGKGSQNRPGNVRFREIVSSCRDEYETSAQKGAKSKVVKRVVEEVWSRGGRFLRQEKDGLWVLVEQEQVEDKVSHAFRNQKLLSIKGTISGDTLHHDEGTMVPCDGSNQKRPRL